MGEKHPGTNEQVFQILEAGESRERAFQTLVRHVTAKRMVFVVCVSGHAVRCVLRILL